MNKEPDRVFFEPFPPAPDFGRRTYLSGVRAFGRGPAARPTRAEVRRGGGAVPTGGVYCRYTFRR